MWRYPLILFFVAIGLRSQATTTGKWPSLVTGGSVQFTVTEAIRPLKDFDGRIMTIVYLERLKLRKVGRNSIKNDVSWLLAQGYRVVELNYAHHGKTISPNINADIIAINDSISAGKFCGLHDCSQYRSYVLFEGYRLMRDVPYFVDDPKVYNTPKEYIKGDSLYMDIIYPANTRTQVPVVLSFSYSNSYATYDQAKGVLTDQNKHQRLKQAYTLAAFNDSFLEGAPGRGIAWAIADHPKYCPWGKGQPVNGRNDAYRSFEDGIDAARKVRSAIRTLRTIGKSIGLSGKIGIYGFSRGSTAGSMAIGDRKVPAIDTAGFNKGTNAQVQAAALGPGVFDYTQIYNTINDGDANLETHCPWVWGELEKNRAVWERQGAAYLVNSSATAPVMFFHNTDDDHYYDDQIQHFKAKLSSLNVPVSSITNYGKGHSVPQTGEMLSQLYDFFERYLK